MAHTPLPASYAAVVIPEASSAGARRQRKLVEALRHQDPRAIDLLLATHGPMLRGFLRDLLADAGAVEDVLQLTLIDVWRRGPSFDPSRSPLGAWVLMIARSRAIDQLRRRVPEPYDPTALAEVVDPESEDEANALAERWRIAALIATLPRDEARLLSLRFYDGFTQSQIAERTGIPLGTVKTRMVRALERLRKQLDSEELGS